MTRLLEYFERYWLSTIGADGFSVYNERFRTNNVCESANRCWGAALQNGKHPSFQEFLQILQHNEAVAAMDSYTLSQDSHARISEYKPRKKVIEKELRIQQEWLRFPTEDPHVIYEVDFFGLLQIRLLEFIAQNKQEFVTDFR